MTPAAAKCGRFTAASSKWRPCAGGLSGGSTAVDLAWFACDGQRGVAEIAAIVTREGHAVTPRQVEDWFDLAAAQGLVRWRDDAAGPA